MEVYFRIAIIWILCGITLALTGIINKIGHTKQTLVGSVVELIGWVFYAVILIINH